MAEFSSSVSRANRKTTSLQTTIPSAVAKMMSLNETDRIVWRIEPKNSGMIVTVRKAATKDPVE